MLNKIGNIEEFSHGDKKGYKIKGATFASSKNSNFCNFDPVEVFSLDNPPTKFNFAHKDKTTDYSTDTIITSKPKGEIKGKLLEFTWDLETTNPNFVQLIENENFGGFSPELAKIGEPVFGKIVGKDKDGKDIQERFYRQNNLIWEQTAILGKEQKPGFVGADKFAIEAFEAFEDVVILSEDFETWSQYTIGDFVKTKENKIGKLLAIKFLESDSIFYEVLALTGETLLLTQTKDSEGIFKKLEVSDIMNYLLTQNNLNFSSEGFTGTEKDNLELPKTEEKPVETPKPVENFEQVKSDLEDKIKELELVNNALQTQIKNTENFSQAPKLPNSNEKFTKTGSVANNLTDEEIQKAKQSLSAKI